MTFRNIEDFRFEWEGGQYVHVFWQNSNMAFDIINVWDYELGKSLIDESTFDSTCEEYIQDWKEQYGQEEEE